MKPAWIPIALLAVLLMAATVQACTPVPSLKAAIPGAVSVGSTGNMHLHYTITSTCTREGITQCEKACMMPGGILDLYCYEECIYSIC